MADPIQITLYPPRRRFLALVVLVFLQLILPVRSQAATLPEDRADAMYHAYDGGGVTVDGPSVLVRKGFKEKVSVYANYYQDMVSSASIDVLTSGSKYSEERNEYSVGMDYLAKRSLLSLGYTNSAESDYEAETVSLGVSQDFFGDMTTLSMGYSRGDDTVLRNEADGTAISVGDAQRQRYNISLTQILTKSWIVALGVETVVDDGFLRNPYRQIRFLQPVGSSNTVGSQAEQYPETRNSDAFALRTMYYLPYRASVRLEARAFSDSWGINAHNYELRYTHSLRARMILEFKLRTYSQTEADFYMDLFPAEIVNDESFGARDKELSTYSSNSIGLGFTYEFAYKLPFAKKHSASVYWDFMQFDYENFRNALLSRAQGDQAAPYAVGEEPTYSFEANVVRLFYSVNY